MQREEILLARLALLAGMADVPLAEIGDSRYYVRYAQTAAELDAVLALRFEVFNLELGEGLAESYETGRDEDEFDAVCRHLTVIERSSGAVVGTYRLQTSAMAAAGRGFYSATEFDLSTLPREVLDDSVEIGRACIARHHRNTRVLFLLWRGLAAYVAHNRKRYLFGCCSLPSREPAAGARAAARLRATGAVDPELEAAPRPGFECRAAAGLRDATAELPKLFALYLTCGARVCGGPAFDRAFGTIDFLVLLDVEQMHPAAKRTFFGA